MYYNLRTPYSNELYHHGIKGQKWGVRRYQNPDGSLTEAGQKRYNKGVKILEKKYKREYMHDTILNRQYKDAEKYVKDKMSKVTMEDAMKAYSTHQKKVAATVAAASAITLTAALSAKYLSTTPTEREMLGAEKRASREYKKAQDNLYRQYKKNKEGVEAYRGWWRDMNRRGAGTGERVDSVKSVNPWPTNKYWNAQDRMEKAERAYNDTQRLVNEWVDNSAPYRKGKNEQKVTKTRLRRRIVPQDPYGRRVNPQWDSWDVWAEQEERKKRR